MSTVLRKEPCPKCRENGGDASGDNLVIYEDGSYFCFACGNVKPSEEYLEKKGYGYEYKEEDFMGKPFDEEVHKKLKENTGIDSKNYRGIRTETSKHFGVRYEYNENSGEVAKTFYPVTKGGSLSGYKVRTHPKDFVTTPPWGEVGKECDLFMQFRFKTHNGILVIVGGEHDALAAYQMLKTIKKPGYDEVAVVSSTLGETAAFKQVQNNYEWIAGFRKVIIAMDSDPAGEKAMESLIKVLPKGKVHVMKMRRKDPNSYLWDKERAVVVDYTSEFISDFWAAKPYTPGGVVGSSQLYDQMVANANVKKIPLPPFMSKLDEMLGSIDLGTIGIIAAGSGAAKTTVANEMIYYWLFNSPYKIGVVSLELTCGQYAQAMLSRHIERKIASIKDPQEKIKFLEQDYVKQKAEELFTTPEGQDRFVVIDERDGSVKVLQDKIEEMIISCDVKVIILDPISDLFDGLPNEEQANLMKWQKSMVKNYNVTFVNIAHIRKGSNNKESASTGAFVPEEAVIGASQQVKSASWVVMLSRDKYAEDEVVRNCTHVMLTKNRSNGVTGKAGAMYYCNQTHRLYDFDEWVKSNGPKEF